MRLRFLLFEVLMLFCLIRGNGRIVRAVAWWEVEPSQPYCELWCDVGLEDVDFVTVSEWFA